MKYRLRRDIFKPALDRLRFSSNERISSIGGGVLIRASTDGQVRLWLSSTDFLIFQTYGFAEYGQQFTWEDPQPLLLPLERLWAVFASSKCEWVTITRKDSSQPYVQVQADGVYDLYTMPTASYPGFDFNATNIETMTPERWQWHWSKAVTNASSDYTYDSLLGVCYDKNFIATDRHRCCWIKTCDQPLDDKVLIPRNLGAVACKIFTNTDFNIGLNGAEHIVLSSVDGLQWVGSPQLAGEFPDYQQFWGAAAGPTLASVSITCATDDLRAAVQRAIMVSGKDNPIVTFMNPQDGVNQFNIKLSTPGDNTTRGVETVALASVQRNECDNDLSVLGAFNAYSVRDAIDALTQPTTTLRFTVGNTQNLIIIEDTLRFIICSLALS